MVLSNNIELSPEEAMLIDYVLTMHTYDYGRLEQLKQPDMASLRKKVGEVIITDKPKTVSFLPTEIEYLLISVPITFRFYQDDVGFSLKRKLFSTYIAKPIEIVWFEEKKNEEPEAAPGRDCNCYSSHEDDSKSSSSCLP